MTSQLIYKNKRADAGTVIYLEIEHYSFKSKAENMSIAVPDQMRQFNSSGDLVGFKPFYIPLGFNSPTVGLEGRIFDEPEGNILALVQLLPDMLVEFNPFIESPDPYYWELKSKSITMDMGYVGVRDFSIELTRQFYVEDRMHVTV